ncbi:TPA: UDP-N-acetylglucosamine 2-epimerase (non-hydrolyzing) [Vibrio cholerae]|uniref:non-hydrolyzing UDP-N-acetylglucosamine 2-epimerase n=1 Tax=Vibrio cholerae TaxID=666 RepID=UPI0021CE527C|nr:UDP-N-acetylglucosamine 2-epimerase (non-hydrolyzing) [Vibrio cholerae]MCU4221727.1 UDP-N-acetylglucosamine 2-epimerase (non-hydrolyzing) [Vibrio cholerae]HCZ9577175.1 UDP-N-acetylglucosamine 2-epimerase (non-hydrolyzing) [Vibrio cholerae]HCZ9602196.1 UDP-N-acetylglucosamine 2-epimerase (non-hydrolyzing) [Vibrio cholerae]HCZ9605480.1 UDP-N-acetylglucosamine 2-epimerase (non-hydrolyzing) [Vibrio cholerae]HCZ9637858.1 UDP-N-acetylglucosamine 2-epimerase (non-hydrolyzing) [Vibrio cholerae]
MQRILTIIGARPQFIKASVVSRAIQQTDGIEEIMLHTGQHFDANMSDIFFNQLNIPRPHIQLDIHGGSHGEMTGRMLAEIELALLTHKPDRVLVYGDTNSTLAGALAAAKLHIPVAHVEAGLRSFNMQMPEEINRILTDQVSDLLFCPTDIAVQNLNNEGFVNKPVQVLQVGDVMQDAAILFAKKAAAPAGNLPDQFILATLHRAENTDNPQRLAAIVAGLNELHSSLSPVVLPLHPRTRKLIAEQGLELNVHLIDPVGYFEMVWLLDHCQLVLTDSGGVQKEAFFFGKACVTMRDQTEWVELIEAGANELVGADTAKIIEAATRNAGRRVQDTSNLYGGGEAAQRIVDVLLNS